MPWEMYGGDPWLTYDEIDAFFRAGERLVDTRKKAADKPPKPARRTPHRRRR